ncbi:hypothetical protein ACS5PK_07385 [Roseateles sp. DB2]|uniref:hypothetical protein n=1 Tax=Roseateles sp. DB2 TaxID=3453717 RepID=UPI003EEE2733
MSLDHRFRGLLALRRSTSSTPNLLSRQLGASALSHPVLQAVSVLSAAGRFRLHASIPLAAASGLHNMLHTFNTVVISGVHSGPDPSPGLGIAKSIKQAYPQLRLIAKDYSLRSSGIHDPVFDEIQVMPAWSEMSLDAHQKYIAEQLSGMQALYISGLDAEIDWLSTLQKFPANVLTPGAAALDQIQKPTISCADELGMQIPEFVPAMASQVDLHSLARRSGWRVWVKGKFHEAYAASSHREMILRLAQMQESWPIEDIFLQRGIQGLERSYTFAAFNGELLGVSEVEKRSQTSAGKTWAAEVSMPSQEIVERIAAFARRTSWTGGCEVEFIRDRLGKDWLIDVNPRFPAYIHGVTICGLNLPGRLIAAVAREEYYDPVPFGGQFTRVVVELPVRLDSRIPPVENSGGAVAVTQKHPSFQPALVEKRREQRESPFRKPRRQGDRSWMLGGGLATGARIRNSSQESIDSSLMALDQAVGALSNRIKVTPALSIKTDPQGFLAQAYLSRGWYAEAISAEELSWARLQGYGPSQLIANGPVAASFVIENDKPVRYAFADSVISLSKLTQSAARKSVGIRIRPSKVASRFGIDMADYHAYSATLDAIAMLGANGSFAAHMHLPADQIGPALWIDCFEELMNWAKTISQETDVPVSAIDIGGGWHSEDFVDVFLPLLMERVAPSVMKLGASVELIFEPGKAVSSNLAKFVANVIEVRDNAGLDSMDVLVDCSIADLPMTQYYAHRIEHYRGAELVGVLSGGKSRVLGSICMETDILAAGISFPAFPERGDKLVFHGAGAYNSSMAWPFAKGETRD